MWFVSFWNIGEEYFVGPYDSREAAMFAINDNDYWENAAIVGPLPCEVIKPGE